MRKCAVRVAYACSKIGLFKWAEECLKEVQLGFPHDKKNHPEFAAFLQKKTEIILDKLEINMIKWPSDDKTIQQIMSRAKVDLLTAEEILKTSPGCNDRQHSVLQKEQARLNIVLGNYEDAYQQICLALEKTRHLSQKIPNSAHYLKAEFSLVRSDVEGKLSLMHGQRESLKTAETVYRNAFGNNHPMLSLTLQKLSATYFDLGCQKEADKCLEESEQICSVLRKDLQEQLNCCTSEFLVNYNLGTHPILKRQERNQGAW